MNLLLETPWWLPTTMIVAGVFVWITGNRRQERHVMLAGLSIALLGIAIIVISRAVDTDRERAVRRTRQLVAAVAQRDWPKFQSLVDPQTSVYGLLGPQAITETFREGAERYNLTSARITGLESIQQQTIITVSIRVLSEQLGSPAATDWELQYQNFGKGWVLYTVRSLGNERISEASIRERLSRP